MHSLITEGWIRSSDKSSYYGGVCITGRIKQKDTKQYITNYSSERSYQDVRRSKSAVPKDAVIF